MLPQYHVTDGFRPTIYQVLSERTKNEFGFTSINDMIKFCCPDLKGSATLGSALPRVTKNWPDKKPGQKPYF